MDGVISIFKNTGMTSFDVVRIVKKASGTKKVGHTGTLDPEASGVLPVCIGKGTKIIDYIMPEQQQWPVAWRRPWSRWRSRRVRPPRRQILEGT